MIVGLLVHLINLIKATQKASVYRDEFDVIIPTNLVCVLLVLPSLLHPLIFSILFYTYYYSFLLRSEQLISDS